MLTWGERKKKKTQLPELPQIQTFLCLLQTKEPEQNQLLHTSLHLVIP